MHLNLEICPNCLHYALTSHTDPLIWAHLYTHFHHTSTNYLIITLRIFSDSTNHQITRKYLNSEKCTTCLQSV